MSTIKAQWKKERLNEESPLTRYSTTLRQQQCRLVLHASCYFCSTEQSTSYLLVCCSRATTTTHAPLPSLLEKNKKKTIATKALTCIRSINQQQATTTTMFDTPKTTKNDGVQTISICPSPPRPKANLVNANTPSPVRMSLLSSNVDRRPAQLLSLPIGQSTSTFFSLASDSPSLAALTSDEIDDESSPFLSSELEFVLVTPSVVTRPIFYYPGRVPPAAAVRNMNAANAANVAPQSVYPGFRLQPRRSSSWVYMSFVSLRRCCYSWHCSISLDNRGIQSLAKYIQDKNIRRSKILYHVLYQTTWNWPNFVYISYAHHLSATAITLWAFCRLKLVSRFERWMWFSSSG